MNKFQVLCSCIKCRQVTTSGQLTRNHNNVCPTPKPEVRFPGNKGRTAWNKGLTQDNDSRVKKNAASIKATKAHQDIRLTEAQREHLSHIAKARGFGGYRENAGRSQKYRVQDSFGKEVVLQSSYELKCSNILNTLGVRWIRPKALKYDDRNYFADFYLTDYDIWLDPKNDYKAKQDADKIRKVIEQNNVKLYVLLNAQLTEEYIASLVK